MLITPIIAIICIAALEVIAIAQGINGAAIGIAVAAIAGLGGYELKVLRDRRKGDK